MVLLTAFKKRTLICYCSMIFTFLVQWFGFIPDSPSETINRKADFMSQGVCTLLKHKHNIGMYQRIKAKGQRDVPKEDQKKLLPVFLPLRKLSPRPRCRRVSRRSGRVYTSSLNCRCPPEVPQGSLPVSLHLLCLSPGGLTPTGNTNAALCNCLCTNIHVEVA